MKSYDETRCRQLLEAYYEGIISPDEQAELKNLLNDPDLPEDLEMERSFFAMLDKATLPEEADTWKVDAMVSDMVAEMASGERSARWRRLMRRGSWVAAAAVAAVLIIGAVMKFDSPVVPEKPLVAETAQPDALQIDTVAPAEVAAPVKDMVAVAKERVAERPGQTKEEIAKAPVTEVPVESVKDEITDEQLRMANETIDEVQAFFDSMMAEWDNADRGVRGLLKNRGTLADSGEKDPEIIENQ